MSESKTSAWICTVCGYVHHGPQPPDECPICGAGPDLFEPHEEAVPKQEAAPVRKWKCLICNYIHEGPEPPEFCPVCGATADQFEPYTESGAVSAQDTEQQTFVIAGGGIAGISAAEAVRKSASNAKIVLLSKESRPPYYRLNLTRYLAEEVAEKDLELHPPKWYKDQKIDLRLDTELSGIDPENKSVSTKQGDIIAYDKLILTMGSHPFVPPIPGVNRENVTVVRTFDQAKTILKICQKGLKVVCIGGGILGLETAGALAERGGDVTVLESYGWLLPRQLNRRGGEILEHFVATTGITLVKQVKIKELVGDEQVKGVLLEDGSIIPADLVVITTGVRPNSYLARLAGLDVNQGIVVDNRLRTSQPDVYAAGDVAEHRGVVYGIWGPSQFMGTIAGMNAAGDEAEFAGIPRSNMLKVLGYDLFSIGKIIAEDGSYEIIEEEVDGKYKYFIFRDQHLIGSILLGDTSSSAQVKKVVEKGQDCSEILKKRPSVKDLIQSLKGM